MKPEDELTDEEFNQRMAERAICERRGHSTDELNIRRGWVQCKWCGLWQRESVDH